MSYMVPPPQPPSGITEHQKPNLPTQQDSGNALDQPAIPEKMPAHHSVTTSTPSALLPLALITLSVIILYLPTSTFPFIHFDDDFYVYQNEHVTKGVTATGIKWAFLPDAESGSYWQPLTWVSLMLDVEIFGVNPSAHHTINWLFHLANAILLYCLIKNTTGYLWRSTFIALIFAVHPVNLESVVWITERKNVLSTFFCLITILAYTDYVNRQTRGAYLTVLGLFVLGLLTKPMLVTLPALLLLLDFWPLQRYKLPTGESPRPSRHGVLGFLSLNRRLLFEKLPFLLLVVAVTITTLQTIAHQGIKVSFHTVPLALRLGNAVTSFSAYLYKLIYPVNLAIFYPFPVTIDYRQVILATLLLGIITTLVLLNLKTRPWLFTGWFWFLISLAPVAGITQSGLWPKMADRWLYIPEIGIILIFAWGVTELADRLKIKKSYRSIGAAVVVLLLLSASFRQITYWRDSTTLLEHSLVVGGAHPVILNNLGGLLLEQNKPLVAITYLKQSLAIDQENATALANMGVAYAKLNQLDEAIKYLEHAQKKTPKRQLVIDNLEKIYDKKRRLEKMAANTLAALERTPDSTLLLNRLGNIYFNMGRIQPAVDYYGKSISLEPANKQAFNELGKIHLLYGRTHDSIAFFKEAIRLDSNFVEAQKNLLRAKAMLAEKKEA